MLREFVTRIGTFLVLIGIGVLILFLASDSSGAANFDYLFWALLAIILGFFLRQRRQPSEPTDRFGVLRRFRKPTRDRKEHR